MCCLGAFKLLSVFPDVFSETRLASGQEGRWGGGGNDVNHTPLSIIDCVLVEECNVRCVYDVCARKFCHQSLFAVRLSQAKCHVRVSARVQYACVGRSSSPSPLCYPFQDTPCRGGGGRENSVIEELVRVSRNGVCFSFACLELNLELWYMCPCRCLFVSCLFVYMCFNSRYSSQVPQLLSRC